MTRKTIIQLGPRDVVIHGKVAAKVDNITVDVEEATEEELAELESTAVILLVKPLPKRTYKGDQ